MASESDQKGTKGWNEREQDLVQSKKFTGKFRTVLRRDRLLPTVTPSPRTGSFEPIIIAHVNTLHISPRLSVYAPVRYGHCNTGALFLNPETPLLVFCRFSHKSQLGSRSWASLQSPPLPRLPHRLTGHHQDLGGRALCTAQGKGKRGHGHPAPIPKAVREIQGPATEHRSSR